MVASIILYSTVAVGLVTLRLALPHQLWAFLFFSCKALRFVKVRAESMQSASQLVPSGALMVHFNADAKIGFACHAAKLYCVQKLGIHDAVCEITHYLYPTCKVIAGHQQVKLAALM